MNKLTLFKFNGEGNIPGTKSGPSRCFFPWGLKIMLSSLVLRRSSSLTSEHGSSCKIMLSRTLFSYSPILTPVIFSLISIPPKNPSNPCHFHPCHFSTKKFQKSQTPSSHKINHFLVSVIKNPPPQNPSNF